MTDVDISILEPRWEDSCPDCAAIVETAVDAFIELLREVERYPLPGQK